LRECDDYPEQYATGGISDALNLQYSTNANLTYNNFTGSGSDSVTIYAGTPAQCSHLIGDTNFAEGKPINYTFNASNVEYQGIDYSNYGEVIFACGRNITIRDSSFANDGLEFANSSDIILDRLNVTATLGYGIRAIKSFNLLLNGSNVTNYGAFGVEINGGGSGLHSGTAAS